MNFITGKYTAAKRSEQSVSCARVLKNFSCHPRLHLFFFKNGSNRQKPHSMQASALFFPIRVFDAFAQHLIAPADSQHRHVCCRKLQNGGFHTILAHPFQVAHRIFASGYNHHIRLPERFYIPCITQTDSGLLLQRVKIGKIRNMRQANHCDIHACPRLYPGQTRRETVLIIQLCINPRNDTCYRNFRQLFQRCKSGF